MLRFKKLHYLKSILCLLFTLTIPMSYNACTGGFNTINSFDPSSLNSNAGSSVLWEAGDATRGKVVWTNQCQSCHGVIDSTNKRGSTLSLLTLALEGRVPQMGAIRLTDQQRIDVIMALNTSSPVTGGTGPTTLPPLTDLTCNPGDDPSVQPVQRLSKRQYTHALTALAYNRIGWREGRGDRIEGPIAEYVSVVPEDKVSTGKIFKRMDKDLTDGHMDGYFLTAIGAAELMVEGDWANWQRDAACMNASPVTDECATKFIKSFGKRVFRRPLKDQEVNTFLALHTEVRTTEDSKAAFKAVVAGLLISPQFIYILETEGSAVPGKTNVFALTDWEIATRASFSLTDEMPSDATFDAIEAGTFSQNNNYENYVRNLMTPQSANAGANQMVQLSPLQATYYYFVNDWLQLDQRATHFNQDGFMRAHINLGGIWMPSTDFDSTVFQREAFEVVNRNLWNESGKFSDLMTDDKFFHDGYIAAFYGFTQDYLAKGYQNPYDYLVHLPNNVYMQHRDRIGLLTRGAFTISNSHTTNPIQRGVFLRRHILCDDLPSPNPDALPDRALSLPEENPNMTTRERYAEKTKSQQCMACHSQINPLGFAFEDFDSLARYRTTEHVFGANPQQGEPALTLKVLPVDVRVSNVEFSPGDGLAVNGGNDMSRKLAQSTKAQLCFARQSFRWSMGRRETTGDACMLKNMWEKLEGSGGSMKEMFTQIALHPNFKLKKVEP